MNLHITGHHLTVTPGIHEHVATKLQKITQHFDHVIDINMILTVEKLKHKVEATVHLSGKEIFCESQESDMYVAIDHLINKLDRAIIKHKEKHLSHRHDAQPNTAQDSD